MATLGKDIAAKSSADAETLIAEYRSVFAEANEKPAPEITYKNGWFKIGRIGFRYRRHGVEGLLDELRRRIRERGFNLLGR